MASIDRRQDGHHRARWREYPGAPQKTKEFRRKKEAELFLDAIRADLAHGRYVDPAGGLTLFRDYAEQWRAGQVHRASTAAQAESYLRHHANPYLCHRPLGSIRRSEVQGWVKGRSEVMAPGSVEVVYRWVAANFEAAVGDHQIGASPCNRIALPKREDGEVVPVSAAQVRQMADACPDRYRALVVLAAGTGLRQGECFGLSVDRVDFLHRQVRVNRRLLGAKAGVPEFGPPKSKAGFRTVPLPDVVSTVMAEHLARYGRGSSDLIFTSSYGTPLRRNTAGEMWHRASRKAELPEWATFHDLRHFYASLLISRGCSVKTVQRRLGHQSAMETRAAVDQVLTGVDERRAV